jgi:hypothetical protein
MTIHSSSRAGGGQSPRGSCGDHVPKARCLNWCCRSPAESEGCKDASPTVPKVQQSPFEKVSIRPLLAIKTKINPSSINLVLLPTSVPAPLLLVPSPLIPLTPLTLGGKKDFPVLSPSRTSRPSPPPTSSMAEFLKSRWQINKETETQRVTSKPKMKQFERSYTVKSIIGPKNNYH